MAHARRALIIAPDDFPGEYDDYVAACRALKLEPNGHCYLVCLVTTAAGPRTLLTVDLALLPDTYEAGTPDQAGVSSTDRSKETASRAGTPGPGRYRPDRGPGPALSIEELLRRFGRGAYPPEAYWEQPYGASPVWGHPVPSANPPQSPRRFEGSRLPLRREQPNPFGRFWTPASPSARQPNRPHVQLVLDLDSATLKGLAVWNPATSRLGMAVKADDAVKAAFRETVANTAATDVIDKVWPPHAPPSGLADLDTALTALKAVLEPQTLLLKMINAAARVAAAHAGFGVLAPLVGQFAEKFCKQYVGPPRDRIVVNILSCVDIDLYAAADELPDCATLRELTVEETSLGIEKLFSARFAVNIPERDLGVVTQEKNEAATEDPAKIQAPKPFDPGDPGGGPSPFLFGRHSVSVSTIRQGHRRLTCGGSQRR